MDLEKAVVARYSFKDKKFEILVDPDKALEFRKGKSIDIRSILAYPAIYRDWRKAEIVNREDLETAFGTNDIFKVAEVILKRGELQLTTEQKRRMLEERKRQIAEIISRKGVNPQTNLPHPPARILNAMEQVGVNIDPFLDAELQVDRVVKEIRKVLPISFEKLLVEIKLPPQFISVYSKLKDSCEIKEEKWLDDGSLYLIIEMPAALQSEIFSKISNLTKGNFQSKVLKKIE